jgi:hypothetical protein
MTGSLALRMRSGDLAQMPAAARKTFPALVIAAVLALAPGATAAAAPAVGKDGRIHACYRVKGKPKGAMRLVRSAKAHCRRGERKVAWVAAGAVGPAGTRGSSGAGGGAPNPQLEAKVAGLTARVENLEGILAGVTHAALLDALNSVAAVKSLCQQATVLTTQANSLLGSLEGTALGGVIPLGLVLTIPGLPGALSAYSCS